MVSANSLKKKNVESSESKKPLSKDKYLAENSTDDTPIDDSSESSDDIPYKITTKSPTKKSPTTTPTKKPTNTPTKKPTNTPTKKSPSRKPIPQLNFQLCDWNTYHEIDGEDEEKYVIQLFGRTADDKDVCLKVTGYTPFFYVEVPDRWGPKEANKFVDVLRNKVAYSVSTNSNYSYDISKSLIRYSIIKKRNFYNFSRKKDCNFIMLVFKNYTAMREYANTLSREIRAPDLTKNPMLYQRFESNIEPHIRFMHINNLSPCGWVTIDGSKLRANRQYSNCDYSYSVNWKEVKPDNNNDSMAPFKIMGYDIECISCDHNFPRADRKTDAAIQIGITMYRYGSMKCYDQHILVLKECKNIKGATVECYKTEKGLLRGWARKVSDLRPDFKAGYNNFGFDDKYIYDRIARIDRETAENQGISVDKLKNKFMDEILQILGKVNNKYVMEVEQLEKSLTYFELKDLKSSALGDNELKFFQIPGILSIDMMKVIQRDHRLVGYKLDNVSANFITEGAVKFVENGTTDDGRIKVDIYTKSTKALEKDSYIQIMVDDSYSSSPLSEGAKYKVHDICTITDNINGPDGVVEKISYQCIKTTINKKDIEELREVLMNKLLKVYWTFAKDDMHHTLINKYFNEGDPEKIKQIAKYCLKDCKLVNLLMAKLEIIVNSIGMANVCSVPLSYLFLRGQGVKIFSLVSKKCRQEGFLIPVLRRKKTDTTGDEDDGYEGATVITPKPGVYLSPIGVLDYSSLYPNSMRERNLSPECYVNNKNYDNLPKYIYHDVYITLKDKKGKIIRNLDGTPQKEHHRFAQELITMDQIKIELKAVFDKITTASDDRINKINNQKYYTHENIITRLDREKALYKKKIADITDKSKLDAANTEYESTIKKLKLADKQITTEKESLETAIKKIGDKISDLDKKSLTREKELDTAATIDTILSELKLSDKDKEILIQCETAKTEKSISDEIAKKYNIVDGKHVRYGILPEILTELLNKRKETNNRMAATKDPSLKSVLNGLQLAYKVTANSLYGQTGATTSPIFFLAIAASTTAVGRERLHYAKRIVEENFPGSEVIYGDTDSIFINFHLKDADGNERTDKDALIETIALCQKAAEIINNNVPKPQSIVYEKTLHPFILVAKKKYVGLLFEKDPVKYYLKSMGIVLKRRDNAPIVKIVVGGIIDHILKNRDINKAVDYTKKVLRKLMDGGYPIDKFIISKNLRGHYKQKKNAKTGKLTSLPSHKILADRMAIRDPGNKPQTNDRIPFVYIVKDMGTKKKKDILQGDLIEHPTFVIDNNLKIDYMYYLEHQIINPAQQILELMMPTRAVEKLFGKFLIEEENKRKGRQSMERWMYVDGQKPRKLAGSKSAKVPHKSLKTTAKNDTYSKLQYVGKTKRLECQNMNKWLQGGKTGSDDWEPTM